MKKLNCHFLPVINLRGSCVPAPNWLLSSLLLQSQQKWIIQYGLISFSFRYKNNNSKIAFIVASDNLAISQELLRDEENVFFLNDLTKGNAYLISMQSRLC